MITIVMNPCPVVTTFMQRGNPDNVAAEVRSVQNFLQNFEKADVSETGEFDERTEAAVKVFQKKHADVILAPWDATRASGIINITTAKKINSIACARPMTLSAAELSVIDGYKTRLAAAIDGARGVKEAMASTSMQDISELTYQTTDNTDGADWTISMVDRQNAAAATLGGAGMGSKFWNFLKGLF